MTPQSDEDEVWRQIVASFNETADDASAEQPWPDRENIPEEVSAEETTEPGDEPQGQAETASGDDEDHYIPPPPPPLPKGDAVSKASWVALFGGPAYLLLAALLGWPMDGWIVFTAVAAFIAGFITLVVRMGDSPPPEGWDDGAVI